MVQVQLSAVLDSQIVLYGTSIVEDLESLKRLVMCLQVEPTNKPGVLDVWALIDTSMHKMTLQVPRTLYVDVAAGSMHVLEGSERFAKGVKKVDRTLPDGSAAEVLLQVELGEEDFIKDHTVRTLAIFPLTFCPISGVSLLMFWVTKCTAVKVCAILYKQMLVRGLKM